MRNAIVLCMYWGWTHIFRFWHFLLHNFFFLKIKGEGLNDLKKAYLLAFSYIRKFKKKSPSFLGLLHTEKKKKKREEGFVK